MILLLLRAYRELIRFQIYLWRGDFAALHHSVQRLARREVNAPAEQIAKTCHVMNVACVWYWTEVLCLQRSAATACLLRRYGVDAQLVVGAKMMPFKAHAWVEVDGRVVNDKAYVTDSYGVLERI
jgi:hypothetical protein